MECLWWSFLNTVELQLLGIHMYELYTLNHTIQCFLKETVFPCLVCDNIVEIVK